MVRTKVKFMKWLNMATLLTFGVYSLINLKKYIYNENYGFICMTTIVLYVLARNANWFTWEERFTKKDK